MSSRVVITGMGVVAPNGVGLSAFEDSLRQGRSGIRHVKEMAEAKFACTVAGVPEGVDALIEAEFDEDERLVMNGSHRYASLACLEAWKDAGLERPDRDSETVDWETGAIIGTGIGGMDTTAEKVIPLTNAGKVRRIGSTSVEQVMASGVSARVSGQFALGNQVTTNSSACSTGTEAIAMGMERIRTGAATRMLCGGSEAASHYIWAGFDAMRVLNRKSNDAPEKASRPMSASAGGFIPGAGAGILLIESEESARSRGARIYAEVAGQGINCGGHRMGGSMTAPNPESVRRCIHSALADAGVETRDVDVINGHLTATGADPREIGSWAAALGRGPGELPPITATKSMIGHTLGAAGAIESVASVLMLTKGFVHPSLNCEDVHPEIEPHAESIPHSLLGFETMKVIVKAGFGFGDVNACLVFKRWED
ncbi:MAG TPA: beta-ketoacyl-[acyl-carrier-protein] synthase family protein [Myxococcales bacterium]|nr:beta-ketoacyl-[acyl-carrier-protein] synthase family protein [Myxococcales bacterium]